MASVGSRIFALIVTAHLHQDQRQGMNDWQQRQGREKYVVARNLSFVVPSTDSYFSDVIDVKFLC